MAEFHNDTDAWPDMFGELSGPSTDHNQTQKPLTLSLLKVIITLLSVHLLTVTKANKFN